MAIAEASEGILDLYCIDCASAISVKDVKSCLDFSNLFGWNSGSGVVFGPPKLLFLLGLLFNFIFLGEGFDDALVSSHPLYLIIFEETVIPTIDWR